MENNQYDFVAIGDTTTDAFIRIKEASVNCDVDRHNCKLCFAFGSKVPYEFVEVIKAVGNSANASVSAARLGLKSALISDVGNDQNGKESIGALSKNNVSVDYMRIHDGMETNYHYVLWYEEERTILVKHQEYPYKLPQNLSAKWIYLSSLGEHSLPYHQEIAEYLRAHPETKLAFQPGTFQIKIGREKLMALYEQTEIFFCNVEEARLILKKENGEIKELLQGMREIGVKIAVITDGPHGAYTFDGAEMLHMPMYPDPKPPYERTGAGDAFASTFTGAIALGKSVRDALMWGPINSMSVVQEVGAQKGLLTREQLEKFLSEAPKDYFPKNI